MRTIGGDFGLVSPHDDEHLTLLVCDVSGHGIGSALVANRLYTEVLAELRDGVGLGEMLDRLNRFVMQSIGSSVFLFTAAVARVDRGGRRMVFAGAGHPPAMIVTPGQQPRLLESRSMVLGALPDAVDREAELDLDLEPGRPRGAVYGRAHRGFRFARRNAGRRGPAENRARNVAVAVERNEAEHPRPHRGVARGAVV